MKTEGSIGVTKQAIIIDGVKSEEVVSITLTGNKVNECRALLGWSKRNLPKSIDSTTHDAAQTQIAMFEIARDILKGLE